MMSGLCSIHKVARVLVIVGGLNWLLVAFNYNLVDMLLGAGSMASKVVYVLVGISAAMLCFEGKCCGGCKNCGMEKPMTEKQA